MNSFVPLLFGYVLIYQNPKQYQIEVKKLFGPCYDGLEVQHELNSGDFQKLTNYNLYVFTLQCQTEDGFIQIHA